MNAPVDIGRRQLGNVRRSGEHLLRRASGSRRPLPDFLIIGAQKAGTTSLHAYLCQHPQVVAPVTKEVHFFDHRFRRGPDWYRAHFPRRSEAGATLSGESTPYYLFHPLAPARVATTVPWCRLVVLLRNPIERAHSHHNHERALGYERLSFEAALEAEAGRLEGEEARLAGGVVERSWAHQHHSYFSRGLYAEQLERWLNHFEREQILVLSAERLFADPSGTVRRTQEFLGLAPEALADMAARNGRSYAPIAAATRERLRRAFEPHNRRLHDLLDHDFGWD